MGPQSLISVVIPVRNGAQFLASAMASVFRQDYENLEVLLVDDGSTDDLSARMEPYRNRLRYLRQEPRGQAAARNLGIRESCGDPVAFLDIDDLWTHTHITTLLGSLQDHPGAGISQGLMRQFWTAPDGRYYRTVPYRMPYLGSCLFRRAVFGQCGLFDEGMAYGEDHDFFYRCWEHDIVKLNVDTLSLLYRRHSGNMTRGLGREQTPVLKRRIERIRRGGFDPSAQRKQHFQHYLGDRASLSELPYREVSECDLLSA
jgi:glycosyltransferase involved in cell wall biosynthesis